MKSFKEQCIELRQKDHTLDEIVAITGRSKTSIYFHIKHIPLSAKKQSEIRHNAKQRAVQIAAARKGKALRPYRTFTNWTPELILLVAHLSFDGEIRNMRCVYSNRSKSLIARVVGLMQQLCDYSPKYKHNQRTGVVSVNYSNVELEEFLYEKSIELSQKISKMPSEFQRQFLKAFFDDEGCMDMRPHENLRRVRGYQKDRQLLVLICELLNNFHIAGRLQGDKELVVSGKHNLLQFQKEINFSPGVYINPNRSNSLWKKKLEKRELLELAITSYKS